MKAQLAQKDEQTICLQRLLQKTNALADDVPGIFTSKTRQALNSYMKTANHEQHALQPDQAATPTKIGNWIEIIISDKPELGIGAHCLQTDGTFTPINSR